MKFVRRHTLTVIAMLVLVYLVTPIAVVGVLSFNDPPSKYNTKWYGFSLDAWTNMCGIPGVCESFLESIKIGLISTFVATILGTMIAFALAKVPAWFLTLLILMEVFPPMEASTMPSRLVGMLI